MAECSVVLVGWWMLDDGREGIVVCACARTRIYVLEGGNGTRERRKEREYKGQSERKGEVDAENGRG